MKRLFVIGALASLVFIGCDSTKVKKDIQNGYNDLVGNKKVVSDGIDYNLSKDIEDMLTLHNQARVQVGVTKKLKWSDTIAADAKKYANELAREGKWEHDNQRNHNDGYGHGDYGENLYTASFDATFADATKAWIEEKKYYTYGVIGDSGTCQSGKDCGHYTQVIWKDTSVVGCAKSSYQKDVSGTMIKKGWSVIVCKYQLPGNVIGEKPY